MTNPNEQQRRPPLTRKERDELRERARRHIETNAGNHEYTNAAESMLRLLDQVEALEAVVERLPLTADGVYVMPYSDPVFNIAFNNNRAPHVILFYNGDTGDKSWLADGMFEGEYESMPVSKCYSTLEALRTATGAD